MHSENFYVAVPKSELIEWVAEEHPEEIKEWIGYNCNPEDVFTELILEAWAKENGWVKESRNE